MSATGDYHVGDLWEFKAVFTHEGTKVKPTTVEAIVLDPSLDEHTVSLTELGTGEYKGQFSLTVAGPYTVSFACSGGYQGSEPQTIQCKGRFG